MSEHRHRLSGREIAVVKHLAKHCGMGGQVVLKRWQRPTAAALWRQALVEIWYRQSLTHGHEGPFYRLTDRGLRLAAALFTQEQPSPTTVAERHLKSAAPSGPAPEQGSKP
jgi:hypothetical protein